MIRNALAMRRNGSRAPYATSPAQALLACRPPFHDTAVFHCQQAVEKSWKAFLSWHGAPFRKTHDLRELGTSCAALDGSLTQLVERAEELTPFAWVFRYPGGPGMPSSKEAEEVLALAREVHEAVLTRLRGELHG